MTIMTLAKTFGKPIAKRIFSSGYEANIWMRWVFVRVNAIPGFRPIFRGMRVEYDVPGHAWTVPFEIAGPAANEVLIRTVVSAVSPGTERAFYNVEANAESAFPAFPGYSLVGEVTRVGKKVSGLRLGQLVIASAFHTSIANVHSNNAVIVPDGVTPEEGAISPIGVIALQGLWRGQPRSNEKAAVFGRGLIGQLTVQLLHATGVGQVVSIAPSQRHVKPGMERFAQRIISTDIEGEDILNSVNADVTFEVSGNANAIRDAVRATRNGGRVVLLGSPRGMTQNFDFAELAERDITLLGAHMSTFQKRAEAYDTILDLIKNKALDIHSLIDTDLNPWETDRFYRHLAEKRLDCVGAIIRWETMESIDRERKISYWTRPDLENLRGMTMKQTAIPETVTPDSSTIDETERDSGQKSSNVKNQKTLRIAIVGSGVRGGENAASVKKASSTTLVKVMDVNETLARNLGERMNVPWTTNYESILQSNDIDAVFINTPHHLHSELAIKAADAGKHIIVEKPPAQNLEEAVRMVDAARKNNVQLSIWLGARYSPGIVYAKKLIEDGALGTIMGACLNHQMFKSINYFQSPGGAVDNWQALWKTAGGGVLINQAVHNLDCLLYLTDMKVTEVSARYATLDSPAEVEDTLVAWLTMENGALVTINAASRVRGLQRPLTEFRLWGSEGHISLTPPYQFYTSKMIQGKRPERWQNFGPFPKLRDSGVEYIERLAQSILGGKKPEITAEDGLRLQAVIEAAYKSSVEKRPISVEYRGI